MIKYHINHHSYYAMKRRCYDPTNNRYEYYGGRGIVVCGEWVNSFKKFCDDMGDKPTSEHSIERIDTNGNYCKQNCIWADRKTQANNKTSNVIVEHNGTRLTLKQLSELSGINYKLLYSRYMVKKTIDSNELLKSKRILRKCYLNGKKITYDELSLMLNVSAATIHRWIKSGKILMDGFYVGD